MKRINDPIDMRDRQSGTINKLLDNYLARFKVYKADTLFEPDYTLLKENRCILCGNKLKIMRDGTKAYCNGKKHRKTFIVGVDKLS
jgi:hypothetical protein